MKNLKVITIFFISAVALCLVSCNSMESDAKKVAKRGYEIQKVYESLNDRSNLSGSRESKEKKIKDYIEFASKMQAKYSKDRETSEKFDQLVKKEIEKLQRKK